MFLKTVRRAESEWWPRAERGPKLPTTSPTARELTTGNGRSSCIHQLLLTKKVVYSARICGHSTTETDTRTCSRLSVPSFLRILALSLFITSMDSASVLLGMLVACPAVASGQAPCARAWSHARPCTRQNPPSSAPPGATPCLRVHMMVVISRLDGPAR